ncbi:hypothetical protein [Streptomyces cyaneofuscatus]|uniref:hypothetical protein n=1 Tax=Streptomyces cyaneofuscatus TaxID=66883 RepID=UPI0033F480B7
MDGSQRLKLWSLIIGGIVAVVLGLWAANPTGNNCSHQAVCGQDITDVKQQQGEPISPTASR